MAGQRRDGRRPGGKSDHTGTETQRKSVIPAYAGPHHCHNAHQSGAGSPHPNLCVSAPLWFTPTQERKGRAIARAPSRSSCYWRRSALEAGRHELLALVAFQILRARFLVAVAHALLLGHDLLALQTRAHERLALVVVRELLALRLRVALAHALLLLRHLFFLGGHLALQAGAHEAVAVGLLLEGAVLRLGVAVGHALLLPAHLLFLVGGLSERDGQQRVEDHWGELVHRTLLWVVNGRAYCQPARTSKRAGS